MTYLLLLFERGGETTGGLEKQAMADDGIV